MNTDRAGKRAPDKASKEGTGRGEAPRDFERPSAPRTEPGACPASRGPHQLLTCRMVSPVSWASCFFCSSEGYGCCGHQKESPCPPSRHLTPRACPPPGMVSPAEAAAESGKSASLGSPGPHGGKQSLASGNDACGWPRLSQQLETNWPPLVRETELWVGGSTAQKGGKRQLSVSLCRGPEPISLPTPVRL